jgi:membrane protease subunit (stomatin/prohibitin family)
VGIFDFVKKQFVDVIQWMEDSDGVLAYRYPMMDMEIQYGAKLTVRDSQSALFIDEGVIADSFSPGLHTLNTQNLPLLTNLKHWDKLFESPFKSDVIFFSKRLQLDRKWGTSNPITLRDPEFGVVRLRAFGIYSYHLSDTTLFYKEVCGTRGVYTVDELDGQLRHLMIAELTQLFANSQVPFIDMAANQGKLAESLRTHMTPIFARYGLMLDNLALENISLPEDLQAVLDKRIGMNMVGDLNRYTQYQVADAIPLAAQNEGGVAGAGAGLGAGFAIAQNMAQAMTPPANNSLNPPASAISQDDIIATLEKLHGLVTKGVLTQAEFDAKKAELLSQLK